MSAAPRLLALLSLLQSGRRWSGAELSSRLEVSARTVRRDVARLRELGYRIDAAQGRDGAYRLGAGTALPPLLFDDEQATAIAIALQASGALGAEIEDAAARALATLRRVMPARLAHHLHALHIATVARAGDSAAPPVHPTELLALARAIRERHSIRFTYDRFGTTAPDGGPPVAPRCAEPHHLVAAHGRWYLLAWDVERDDWRLFAVHRIALRTPSGPRFARRQLPTPTVGEFVAARFKGSDIDAWPCRGAVVLQLPAGDVIPFAGDGTVTPIDDRSCTLEAGSWSWDSLAASFGRFGADMRVVGPPELAAAFASVAERFAHSAPRRANAGLAPDAPAS